MHSLLDTHQHLIYPTDLAYSWPKKFPELDDKAFTLEDYKSLMSEQKMSGSIFMEVDVDEADMHKEARFVAELSKAESSDILGIIAACRPETDDGFEPWIEECADLPVCGFRRILHQTNDGVSQTQTFRNNVAKLGSRGFTFDMCFMAHQLPIAIDLADACPNTTFVLDHCGNPDVAGGGFEQWSVAIKEIAKRPHVNCKISGILVNCAPGTHSYPLLRPYLEYLAETFGPDRLVWGSDWPVVNLATGIESWLDITAAFMSQMSNEDANKLASSNATRIYGI